MFEQLDVVASGLAIFDTSVLFCLLKSYGCRLLSRNAILTVGANIFDMALLLHSEFVRILMTVPECVVDPN